MLWHLDLNGCLLVSASHTLISCTIAMIEQSWSLAVSQTLFGLVRIRSAFFGENCFLCGWCLDLDTSNLTTCNRCSDVGDLFDAVDSYS